MTISYKPSAALLAALALVLAGNALAERKPKKDMIDKSEAKATATAPESTQVEKVTIPYDANLPQFVVVVEPFDYSASGEVSGAEQSTPGGGVESGGEVYTTTDDGNIRTTWSASSAPAIGKGIAKQLTSALGGWANVTIIEPDAIQKKSDGTYDIKLQPGEVGPFIIRGTVTEFSETAEAEGRGKGFDSRKLGVATGLIGAITGNRDVAAVGTGVAIVGPQVKKENMKRTGMVGMDIRVLDGRIARVTPGGAFDVQGSFTTVSAGSDISVLGISSERGQMASSSLGQATRAAMNDALLKTHATLLNAKR